ncbi:MAG TPA: aspartate aminotransferase family protein [Flavobacteriales bacterium]|nr:aspartate aminotransferase family protein [Flavobacteriales bacterium]HNU57201.1 aspartate aminotransferase family protein [Flavobacteriales bacterium]
MTDQLTRSQELIARRKAAVPNGVGMFNYATAAKASGATITDEDGRELIDFAGGIGVVNAGHCPPPVVKAIQEQAEKFLHVSFNVASYEPYVALCEKLNALLPHGGPTKTLLVSTGAEAVENAIKIARQATKRSGVLCFTDAFHGRTMMAMTLTSKVGYKPDCGPFAPEVYRTQYPNYFHYGAGRSEAEFAHAELQRLEELSHNLVDPKSLACVIIELVQGEGGFNVAPKAYVEGLRSWCDQHGILLIFDEIQAGFGRTGAWSAYDHFGVTPDLSTWAKSLGSGLPIAAVMGKAGIMDKAGPSSIGGTYIGSPVSCAAALATLKYMEEIDINAKGRHVGGIIRARFEQMKAKHDCIGDVRGLGAMMAMEFNVKRDPNKPDADTCTKLMNACAARDLVVITAGTDKNVIRVLSPLVISDELLHKGLDIMEEELEKICA